MTLFILLIIFLGSIVLRIWTPKWLENLGKGAAHALKH